TRARLEAEGHVALPVGPTPFAGADFPTPSGKVELYCQRLADLGHDPVPGRFDDRPDDGDGDGPMGESLWLLTGAGHPSVSSSSAGQPGLRAGEGPPFVEVHPDDAAARGIADGDEVMVANGRGSCRLRAVVTDAVRRGVLVSPKGHWSKLSG